MRAQQDGSTSGRRRHPSRKSRTFRSGTDIDALLGQEVKKGEVLARLNSSELSTQQLAYLRARAQLELNRRNAERAKSLFEADVIGAAELQRRQSEFQISVAETRAASDQLQLLGVTPASIERLGQHGAVNSLTPVVSTLNGHVVERKLAQGQVVQPADALFVVADLSRLWAVAQVPEQQVSQVKVVHCGRNIIPKPRRRYGAATYPANELGRARASNDTPHTNIFSHVRINVDRRRCGSQRPVMRRESASGGT